jgi:hypothetical protein
MSESSLSLGEPRGIEEEAELLIAQRHQIEEERNVTKESQKLRSVSPQIVAIRI